MRRLSRRLPESQLNLFQAAPKTPAWQTLPPDVRCRTVSLLARLLREHRARGLAAPRGKGVADE